MYELFPPMMDRPESKQVAIGILYWFFFSFFLPPLFLIVLQDFLSSMEGMSLFTILYCLINFIVVGLLFRPYLVDSFFQVRLHTKKFVGTVAIASIFALFIDFILTVLIPEFGLISNLLPINELPYTIPIECVIFESPIWAFLCLVVMIPVTVSCLYYGVVFAPICVDRPVFAYLAVVLLSVVPRIAGYLAVGGIDEQISLFFAQLPWHLIACWSYQKTDTIWAPICVYAGTNLLAMLLFGALLILM